MHKPVNRFSAAVFRAAALAAVFLGCHAATAEFDLQPIAVPLGLFPDYAFLGESNGVLILGAVWPPDAPASMKPNGLYVLQSEHEWLYSGKLPEQRAHPAVATTPDGVLVIGGTGEAGPLATVIRLQWTGAEVSVEEDALPPLPEPRSHAATAFLDGQVYVAGGRAATGGAAMQPSFLALDVAHPERGWAVLEPWRGAGRLKPLLVAQEGQLLLAGGESPSGILSDYYRFHPGTGWTEAAPSPITTAGAAAVPYGPSHVLVFGGSQLLGYHGITNRWADLGKLPQFLFSPIAVQRENGIVLAGNSVAKHIGPETSTDAWAAFVAGGVAWKLTPRRRGNTLSGLDYTAIVVYLGVLVAMGFYFSKREKDTDAFFLGGRKVPWWAVGMSIFGTSLSAITYLSIPARAFATDWVYLFANMGILFIAPLVAWYYIPRFRAAPINTAYEYLEQRFNLPVRIYGSLCFLAFQIGRVGIVMLLPAMALSATTGLDIYFSVAAMGFLATLYTVLGGIEAVIWTDVVQAIVLVTGALLALVIIMLHVDGGVPGFFSMALAEDKFRMVEPGWSIYTASLWLVLAGNAFSNFYPATADQTIVQRYLATADEKSAARAVWTNALLTIPISVLFFGLGTALWAYFVHHPEQLDPTLQNDAILPLFLVQAFPTGLRGIVIAGIFAASMSSLDSSLNSVASVLVNDYYRRFRRGLSEAHALKAARIITLAFGVFGTLAALYAARLEATSLWEPFLMLLNFVGSGLAGIVALGVFTRRASGPGALAGAAASSAAIYWIQKTPVHFFAHGMVGFTVAFLVGYAVSLLLPGRVQTAP